MLDPTHDETDFLRRLYERGGRLAFMETWVSSRLIAYSLTMSHDRARVRTRCTSRSPKRGHRLVEQVLKGKR